MNKSQLFTIFISTFLNCSQTGRKPSGLCGAALYISALSQGLKVSKSDIVSQAFESLVV